ncbi:MAG: AgmX/PglI C-terminal domain-containing protein [Myxococcales bacterium]|nr:AgmX/PglI C-terminal domain-containing protein [Myxococcales bacterium]
MLDTLTRAPLALALAFWACAPAPSPAASAPRAPTSTSAAAPHPALGAAPSSSATAAASATTSATAAPAPSAPASATTGATTSASASASEPAPPPAPIATDPALWTDGTPVPKVAPASPTPSFIVVGKPSTDGPVPAPTVARLTHGLAGRMRMCFELALRSTPEVAGRLEVRFVIGRDGNVSSAKDAGPLAESPLGRCASRMLYGLSFPRYEGGLTRAVFRVSFVASGDPKGSVRVVQRPLRWSDPEKPGPVAQELAATLRAIGLEGVAVQPGRAGGVEVVTGKRGATPVTLYRVPVRQGELADLGDEALRTEVAARGATHAEGTLFLAAVADTPGAASDLLSQLLGFR